MEIKLFELFRTDTLRHRETARIVVNLLEEKKETQNVIDFDQIVFASRSFLHELLCDIGNKKVVFHNTNEEIRQMMEIAKKGVHPLLA